MKISENKNFKEVKLYDKKITIKELLSENLTKHLKHERLERFNKAVELNIYNGKQSKIHTVFWVDKNHPDGPELHCVTHKGIIFIINERKYYNDENSFITVLLARPNQVKRLYESCSLSVPEHILEYARFYLQNKLNK